MVGITAPTLVVHGELDARVPPENGRVLAGRIPGAELVMIPKVNHLLMTDRPGHVSKVLVERLDPNR